MDEEAQMAKSILQVGRNARAHGLRRLRTATDNAVRLRDVAVERANFRETPALCKHCGVG